jgi:hypothetical protein
MVGKVVLSRRQIENLDSRLERASRKRLAEKNHQRHEQWYAQWLAREEAKQAAKNAPQVKVKETLTRVLDNTTLRPGTIGAYVRGR